MTATVADPAFEALLEFVRRVRGFDLTGYKRSGLERRFRRRLDATGCDSYGDYLDHLEVHPDEYGQLFDALLVNVTEFFRDPPAWDHLRESVLPALLEATGDAPIRVWSAGCATGEEAFTVAIVLAEALGVEAFRERVKVYATDVDDSALAAARQAVYPAKRLESVPEALRERYFERRDGGIGFRRDLRRTVIFGRNDLMTDPPISRLDLLLCRNTLMYFNAEAQGRILGHFHFALRDHGVLVLGKSETLVAHRDRFTALDRNRRIFGRAAGGAAERAPFDHDRASRDAALEVGPNPQILVSRSGTLAFANLAARTLFAIPAADVGRPFAEAGISYRPVELRGPLEEALRERRRVAVGDVRFKDPKGDERVLTVSVTPLLSDGPLPYGATVVFEDITRSALLQAELDGNLRDLELAYEELQSAIDELETTNEELQSANEELQTSNEELQSTNEELETMNEELQSTNEELRDRTGELDHANEFLDSILTSLGIGVAVVDREQRVQIWNDRAENLWGIRADEAVDHQLPSLDIGLPVQELAAGLGAVLGGASDREGAVIEAVDRRGRSIACTTTILPLIGADGVRGAIVLMENRASGSGT